MKIKWVIYVSIKYITGIKKMAVYPFPLLTDKIKVREN